MNITFFQQSTVMVLKDRMCEDIEPLFISFTI